MTFLDDEGARSPASRPGRRVWLAAGGAITAVVLLLAVVGTAGTLWGASSPRETRTAAESYPGPVYGIDLYVSIGDVLLTGGDGEGIDVERRSSWKGAEPRIEERMSGEGVFTARAGCADDPALWFAYVRCEVGYDVAVPAGAEADVQTDVSDIAVDGFDGTLDLVTSTGAVDARGLRSDGVSVQTSTGDVLLAFDEVRGDIDVDARTGDVTVLVPDDGTTFEIRYASGVGRERVDIATEVSGKADHVIDVDVSVGDLEVRYAPS